MENLWQALAALNIITLPIAVYYFNRCRGLEDSIEKSLHIIKHYHSGYYRMATLAGQLRDYSKGLVRRINRLRGHQGDADEARIA